VSVVVCSYNGASTLEQCLRSLQALDYPDFEVILVDDGSTDNTTEISAHFPQVHTIRQNNKGLSAARNVGLRAATGSIVAYTDSDCFADRDWLTRLVHQLQHSGAHAVGGPNLTPDDGALAACVAVSPGQPMHVLDGDQVAEHIPGCNMAFYRDCLLSINGFDERYRKAGDDVDACWRLQQNGGWITFAPGAFVWHHRRQNPRAFMRQQAGYGEAEGLLWFDHPDRFNRRGESRWRGMLYGESVQGLRFGSPIIYHGTFGTGLFQTVYQPDLAHWATLPSTLEWHIVAALIGVVGFVWAPFWGIAACMLVLSFGVAALQAVQAPLPTRYRSVKSLLLVATLCYRQPWCALGRATRRASSRRTSSHRTSSHPTQRITTRSSVITL
jgi:glycosyltransferase involved in cell wall biosynthesis